MLNTNTSNHQISRRILWKTRLLWACLLTIIYILVVLIVEYTYEKRKSEGWKTYTTKNSPLLDDQIRALAIDTKGQVWIGTKTGLYVLSTDGSWTIYTEDNSALYNDDIQALLIDRLGRAWVGTNNGLYVLDYFGQWSTYIGRNNNRLGTSVKALGIDSIDRVWVGTNRGLSVFDVNGQETIYIGGTSGFDDPEIGVLAVDRFDRIWIRARGSPINILDQEGHWTTIPRDTINNPGLILTFEIDQQDRVWIGTNLGINVLSPYGFWMYPQSRWESSLSSLYVDALAIDKQERIWVGTLNELFTVDDQGNQIRYTPTNSGLPGWVRVLEVDNNERLWVGTIKGLSMIDLGNGLPETVSEDFLNYRSAVRAPINFISTVGKIVFFPVVFFAPFYVPLLVLIMVSLIMVIKSKNHGKIDQFFMIVFIVSSIGAVIIWILSAFLYIAVGD